MTAVVVGLIDHGSLIGLADDDHPQYTLAIGEIRKITGPLTQVEYDAITTPDADTLYAIVG